MRKISILIPCYNEEATIHECLQRVIQLELNGWEKEIIVIDDGSTDRSFCLIEEFKEKVQVYRLSQNRGKGEAVRFALEKATGQVVLVQDADLEYDPADYQNLLAPFDLGAQAVFGVRQRPYHQVMLWLNPYFWGGTFINIAANILYFTWIKDIHSGYKVFQRVLIAPDLLKESGFSFCHELTATLLEKKIKIEQVPIGYYPRSLAEGKKIRAKDGLQALVYLVKRRLKSML